MYRGRTFTLGVGMDLPSFFLYGDLEALMVCGHWRMRAPCLRASRRPIRFMLLHEMTCLICLFDALVVYS